MTQKTSAAEKRQSPNKNTTENPSEDTASLKLKPMEEIQVAAPDGYEFVKTIGDGSFGKVKLGIHKLTGEKVAIKILCKQRIKDPTDIVRISRQIKIMKAIRHPFVIQTYEIIESPKYLFLVMEYVEGGDLFDAISNVSKLPEDLCRQYFSQIILGLEYLHGIGITHRDMKPQNILIGEEGRIKIADFGLGNFFKQNQKLKTACGSPCYAPPEMLNQEEYDPSKVDIWSSGVLLFAMVHGYLPFEDDVTSMLYEKIKTKNPRVSSSVSIPCRNLLRGILNKSQIQRWDLCVIKKQQFLVDCIRKYEDLVQKETKQINLDQFRTICEQLDIEEEDRLLNNLLKNKHNNLTTLYYLGRKGILKHIKAATERTLFQAQSEEPQKKNTPAPEETDNNRQLYSFFEKDQTKANKTVEPEETPIIQQKEQKQQVKTENEQSSKTTKEQLGFTNRQSEIQSPQVEKQIPSPIKESTRPKIPSKIIQANKEKEKRQGNKTEQAKYNIKETKTPTVVPKNIQPKNIIKPITSPKNPKISPIPYEPQKKVDIQDKTKMNNRLKKAQRMPIVKPKEQLQKITESDIKLYERSQSKERPIVFKNTLKNEPNTPKHKTEQGQMIAKSIHSEPHLIDTERIVLCSAQKLCQYLQKRGIYGKLEYYNYGKDCIFVSKIQIKSAKMGNKGNDLQRIISDVNQQVAS